LRNERREREEIVIIQCKKCGTKYRFDKSLIEGEGIWVRCSRCKNVFFQTNPAIEQIDVPADVIEKKYETIIFDEKVREIEKQPEKRDGEPGFGQGIEFVEEEKSFDFPLDEEPQPGAEKKFSSFDEVLPDRVPDDYEVVVAGEDWPGEKRKGFWTPGRIVAYPLVVIIVFLSVYLWFFPQVGRQIFDKVSPVPGMKEISGEQNTAKGAVSISEKKVFLKDIKERPMENRIIGNILIIEGVAVNKNDSSVSKVKVSGKILDLSGNILAEREVYGGNILTEEELKNLTEEEIRDELSNPDGSDFANRNIPYDGKIPFMIVFSNPPEKASEYLIGLAGIKGELNQ